MKIWYIIYRGYGDPAVLVDIIRASHKHAARYIAYERYGSIVEVFTKNIAEREFDLWERTTTQQVRR